MKRDKSYYGRIANNTQRAYYFIEQFKSDNLYYCDFRSFISDISTFRRTWKKFAENYFRRTGVKLFGVIEHQGRSPWNYHVHAIGVWGEELSEKAIAQIKAEWRRMGGSSGKIDRPWEDDPYRKLRYILKPSYGNRGKGRKTKSTDRCLNQHLWLNLYPSPWKGQMLPTNRVHATKLKELVLNYFSEENETNPTLISSII